MAEAFHYVGPAVLTDPQGHTAEVTADLSSWQEEMDRFHDGAQIVVITESRWGGRAQLLSGANVPLTIHGRFELALPDGRVGWATLRGWRSTSEAPVVFELAGIGPPPAARCAWVVGMSDG